MRTLKIMVVVTLILGLTFSFVSVKKAEAMNNESAAMLAGAIVLFGKPILNAIMYPERQDYYERPTRVVYKKVYVIKHEHYDGYPPYYSDCRPPFSAYERGWCDEMRRLERKEYRYGRRDARRYYYEYMDP